MVAGMNCFPCFNSQKSKKSNSKKDIGTVQENVVAKPPDMKKQRPEDGAQVDASNINAKQFTFRELATATKNFRQECLICEAGFGRVYKGIIPATGQAVAVKQLDRNGMHGSKEFMSEVHTLSQLKHENIVNFIGYCAYGDQRLMVFEFVQGGNLEEHLLAKANQSPLDWFTRMKIAAGVARGLEYLHESANPPIIFRDMKPSNIWLDKDYNVKLFDFALNNQSSGDKMNPAPPRVMGTYGYCAPEYVRTGNLTLKSDVYSFGVVLLELITGRRAVDTTKPNEEQNLVSWAQPLFRDPKRYPDMADPLLNKNFPEKDLNQAVAIAAMCLQEEAEARPLMSDAVTALSFLSAAPPEPPAAPAPVAAKSVSKKSSAGGSKKGSGSESDHKYQSGSESSYSKSSRRNSTISRSRSRAHESDSESESASSCFRGSSRHQGDISQKKTSRKSSSKESGEKSSKKTTSKELSKKSSKNVSSDNKELNKKSTRKSSTKKSSLRLLSHKSSMESDDETISMSRHSSSVFSDDESVHRNRILSQRGVSFGLISTGSISSSMRSDEGSGHQNYERNRSSSASYRSSVHSR